MPGLIFKIQDKKGYWSFNLVQVNSAVNKTIQYPATEKWQGKLISKSDFIKERVYYMENATLLDIANKQIIYTDDRLKMEDIKKDKERAAKNNLWLEVEL